MQEQIEAEQTFRVPEVNILHEAAEPARTNSIFAQQRLAGEPRMGNPTNKQAAAEASMSTVGVGDHESVPSKYLDDSTAYKPSALAAQSTVPSYTAQSSYQPSSYEKKDTSAAPGGSDILGSFTAGSSYEPSKLVQNSASSNYGASTSAANGTNYGSGTYGQSKPAAASAAGFDPFSADGLASSRYVST